MGLFSAPACDRSNLFMTRLISFSVASPTLPVLSDHPETVGAGGGEAEAAGREGCSSGESTERRSR